jgi:hypothetical protein
LGDRWPRSCAGDPGRRRRTTAARQGNGARVHHSTRGFHQDDGKRTVSTTAGTRRGDGEARRSHDEQPRRRSSGEDGPAARCTSAQTSDTRESLTKRRFHRAAPKRRTGGETAANGRNRSGGVHGGGQLGLGGGGGTGAARVLGEGPRGVRRRLNRGVEAPGSVGLAREAGSRRGRRRHGACGVRVGLGHEVGDDTRVPRVSLSGAGRLWWAVVGRNRLGWAAASGRGGRVGGPPADFARWAAITEQGSWFFLFFSSFQILTKQEIKL